MSCLLVSVVSVSGEVECGMIKTGVAGGLTPAGISQSRNRSISFGAIRIRRLVMTALTRYVSIMTALCIGVSPSALLFTEFLALG